MTHDMEDVCILEVCLICGLPLRPWDKNEDDHDADSWDDEMTNKTEWWGDIRLLSDPSDEVGQLIPALTQENLSNLETNHLARAKGSWRRSELLPIEICTGRQNDDGTWTPFGANERVGNASWRQDIHLPLHNSCLELAHKVFSTSHHSHLRDLRGLWTTLRWRHGISIKCEATEVRPPNYMLGRLDYRLLFWYKQYSRPIYNHSFKPKFAWPGSSENPRVNFTDLVATNPLAIKDLTAGLLKNLVQTPKQDTSQEQASRFWQLFASLPPELTKMIYDYLPFRDLPRLTTSVLPQFFWKTHLENGSLPWLWDLSSPLIATKAAEPCPGGSSYEWNWELLFRQLSRCIDFGLRNDLPKSANPNGRSLFYPEPGPLEHLWTTTGYHDDLRFVPPGLHHRRRVWQLLEEMFVGDVIPWTDELWYQDPRHATDKFIQMYWAKNGDVLIEPFWVPRINTIGHVRRISGEVYIHEGLASLQYWQERRPPGIKQMESASPEEIREQIRSLGPPVSLLFEDILSV